ncbi:hypothetical protein A6U96_14055 [Agrobacterium tumefaciens]|nr:hypothetical protein A6U96_14055 [Agrobacterium tumefaciens]
MAKAPENNAILSGSDFLAAIGKAKVETFTPAASAKGKTPVGKFLEDLTKQVELLKAWDGKKELDWRTAWFRPDTASIAGVRVKWGRQPVEIGGTRFVVAQDKATAIQYLESLKALILNDSDENSAKIQQAIIDQANNRSAALSAAKRK